MRSQQIDRDGIGDDPVGGGCVDRKFATEGRKSSEWSILLVTLVVFAILIAMIVARYKDLMSW